MNEVVSAYEQDIQFITGFAGSGKSTALAKECKDDDTLVLTPTHQAANVLRSKGILNVYTIHSVLKLIPTINESFRKGEKMEKLKKIGDTDLKGIRKIAIDEFSMINVAILDMLLEVLPSYCKVLVFGDPYQLPPVDGEPIDPEAYTDNIVELTTQHRAEAPEVVETFMRFMSYIKYGTGRDLKLNPNIKEGSLKDFNPGTDRALAYTNDEVIWLNDLIAGYLGKEKDLICNDPIMCNGLDGVYVDQASAADTFIYPTCISKGALMDGDKLRLAILKTEMDIEKYGTDLSMYDTCMINIDDGEFNIYYDLHHYRTEKKLKAEVKEMQRLVWDNNDIPEGANLAEWCRNNRHGKYVQERGRAWADYLKHKNLVFDLRRPYATTVHKSQGKEFETVYISQADIKKSIRNNYYEQYARLMYVALSRAIKKVIIIKE